MNEPEILINPMVAWAVHPAHLGTIEYVPGDMSPQKLPSENEVITRPFLVDPRSRQPVPVRVVQIQRRWDHLGLRHILAVVVAREQ
jgi:hypothetical protein